jgi:hypothetical protein
MVALETQTQAVAVAVVGVMAVLLADLVAPALLLFATLIYLLFLTLVVV